MEGAPPPSNVPSTYPIQNQPQVQFNQPIPVHSGEVKFDKRTLYTSDSRDYNIIEYLAIFISYLFSIILFPVLLCSFKVVKDYQRAVIFRMGRIMEGARGPGTFLVLPCTDEFHVLDLRSVTFDVPKQEILTADSVTVQVDAVIYYKVFDPVIAVANIQNYAASTQLLASSILRNILGTKTLSQILSEREAISQDIRIPLDEGTDPWGVKVERVEIKDVRLPQNLQRAMAAEAEAAREAKAKIVAAEGERDASNSLKEASNMLAKSPGALQLRFLQTINSIAAEKNSTILFPLPLEIASAFSK